MTDDNQRKELLDEIIRFTTPPTLAGDEFTVNDYRKQCPSPKPTREAVRSRLNALVDQGVLESRKVLRDAKWTVAYRKVEQDLAGHTGGDPATRL